MSHRNLNLVLILAVSMLSSCTLKQQKFDFNQINDRVWLGEDFWSVPLEDWRVENGRIECIGSLSNSRVNVLTHRLNGNGKLDLSFRLGMLERGSVAGMTGVRLAMKDDTDNSYKSICYHGKGIDVGINTDGKLFINDEATDLPSGFDYSDMTIEIKASSNENDKQLNVSISDINGMEASMSSYNIKNLQGMIALVNFFSEGKMSEINAPKFWFDDLKLEGSMVEENPQNAFGPILFSMYTLSKGSMNISAQLPPIGKNDNKTVQLQILKNEKWELLSEADVDKNSYVASFKVENWNDTLDQDYRLVYTEVFKNGSSNTTYREGVIRKDPRDKALKVGGFTCQYDYGFPYTPLVDNVDKLNPDLLYFSGDQIYESNGGYGIIRHPADRAILNYLGKWYMFGWAFGDLMKDRPTITIPDDHEVFQGNLWGAGGKIVTQEDWKKNQDCTAGFVQPIDMVNVVMSTNCAHLPDPVDPVPMDNGIQVYFTDLLYGNVSFAIVGDRVFKSGVENISWWSGRKDHVRKPIPANKLDRPDLTLLGERQLAFLDNWIEDWEAAEFKCLLSQTIFANASTHHGSNKMFLYGDMDSGGWPKTGRDRVVKVIRKAAAFHICGDQHLPSFAQYGITDYHQGGWVFCTPAITTGYERRFLPEMMGIPIKNRPAHNLPNTGEFTDIFGNPHYVYAVGNPEDNTSWPNRYRQAVSRASGFGISIFDPQTGNIRNEAYRFNTDLSKPLEENMFPGWPVTINKLDNLGNDANIELPTITVSSNENPVVKVYDNTGDLILAVRTNKGEDFTPMVRKAGKYKILVGSQDDNVWKEYIAFDDRAELIEVE